MCGVNDIRLKQKSRLVVTVDWSAQTVDSVCLGLAWARELEMAACAGVRDELW